MVKIWQKMVNIVFECPLMQKIEQHYVGEENFDIKFRARTTLIHKTCQKTIELFNGLSLFSKKSRVKSRIKTLKRVSILTSTMFVTILDI